MNAVDFGDLLLHKLTLFTGTSRHPRRPTSGASAICWSTSTRTPTSRQYLWLRLLAQEHRNLCCVGDDDQSIYSWRGAEIGNILRFENDFPGALIVRLEQNYRSTPEILAAAAGIIAHNRGRLGKTLWTRAERGREGRRARGCGTPSRRRAGSATRSRRCSARGTRCSEIAILVRAGFQTREFEERFIALGAALPRDRRPALLRAPGDPRRAGLSAADPSAGRRPRFRAHRQHAAPRHRHRDDAAAARCRPRRAGCRWSRRRGMLIAGDQLPRAARNALGGFLLALDGWRARAERDVAYRPGADRARRIAATPACGRPTNRRTRRAGSKTSRSWSSRWPSSRISAAFSNMSAW